MDEMIVKITENEQRAKSNTHQIEEIKERLERNEEKMEKLSEISVTLAVIAADIAALEKNQQAMKTDIEGLACKMDEIDNKTKIEWDWAAFVNEKLPVMIAALCGCGGAGYVLYKMLQILFF